MKEEWKKVEGFEDYEVSNLGNVKSLKFGKQRILKPGLDRYNYYQVAFSQDKKQSTKQVHKLVAIAFLNHKPCGYKLVVDHIDNNSLNNKLNNLQIITQRENAYRTQGEYSSKYKGVCWNKVKKKWQCNIRINGILKHLGYFINEEEASNTYQLKINSL